MGRGGAQRAVLAARDYRIRVTWALCPRPRARRHRPAPARPARPRIGKVLVVRARASVLSLLALPFSCCDSVDLHTPRYINLKLILFIHQNYQNILNLIF